jgi:hypothetical protein
MRPFRRKVERQMGLFGNIDIGKRWRTIRHQLQPSSAADCAET